MSAKPFQDDNSHAATRGQLIEAAGEVFSQSGFHAATVRQICERAGVNVAAINYHFGDKEALYEAVLEEGFRCALEKYPADFGLGPDAGPEQRLHAFVRSFLLRIFSQGPESRHGRLMAREMIEPTAALDNLIQKNIRPMCERLMGIVGQLLGRKASEATIRLCAMSVVSQVLFYHNCRTVMSRLFPDQKIGPDQIEELASHITEFSLAAIRQMGKAAKTKS
jgi:AcrR family transcriptional regulator